jgi:hypothetical protein
MILIKIKKILINNDMMEKNRFQKYLGGSNKHAIAKKCLELGV